MTAPKTPDLPSIEGPGVAPKRIQEIEKAAEAYTTVRDKRVKLSAEEVVAKGNLIGLLHAHEAEIGKDENGVIRYKFDDTLVELAPKKEVLKVKDISEEDEE